MYRWHKSYHRTSPPPLARIIVEIPGDGVPPVLHILTQQKPFATPVFRSGIWIQFPCPSEFNISFSHLFLSRPKYVDSIPLWLPWKPCPIIFQLASVHNGRNFQTKRLKNPNLWGWHIPMYLISSLYWPIFRGIDAARCATFEDLAMIFIIRIHVVDFCDKSCIYDILTLLKNEEIKG